jgi:tryptophanyl-tRNA synthetase
MLITTNTKQVVLTGDTPTGRLHLGHWVGSLANRVVLQNDHECFFIIANTHAFTTRLLQAKDIHQSVLDLVLDYLAAGIDPAKSTIFLQSEVGAIAELCVFFSMLVPFPRLMRNPTIKDEIRDKNLGDNYSFGFLLYPIAQIADILAFRPTIVPVGADQIPHLEMTREVARRFNQLYCGVSEDIKDSEQIAAGGLLPIINTYLSRTPRLVGTGAPGRNGKLLKMSKSLDNAIFLSDDPDTIAKKVKGMYTDPRRIRATDPGNISNNPLWIFHEIFNPDKAWVQEASERYKQGAIGDVACKQRLVEVLVDLLEPMYRRRLDYAKNLDFVTQVLRSGTIKANVRANTTLALVKAAMQQQYW